MSAEISTSPAGLLELERPSAGMATAPAIIARHWPAEELEP